MTDFEIQRQLRQLGRPRTPQSDLWPAISTRITRDARPSASRGHKSWLPLAAAAGLLLAVATGLLLPGMQRPDALPDSTVTSAHAGRSQPPRMAPGEAREAALARGGDPRMAGAAAVLDAANAELAQALDQHPDAVFLVSLLNRTNAQRMKLDHVGANAG